MSRQNFCIKCAEHQPKCCYWLMLINIVSKYPLYVKIVSWCCPMWCPCNPVGAQRLIHLPKVVWIPGSTHHGWRIGCMIQVTLRKGRVVMMSSLSGLVTVVTLEVVMTTIGFQCIRLSRMESMVYGYPLKNRNNCSHVMTKSKTLVYLQWVSIGDAGVFHWAILVVPWISFILLGFTRNETTPLWGEQPVTGNPSMDKWLHQLYIVGWNYLAIPKLRWCIHWSLGMDK